MVGGWLTTGSSGVARVWDFSADTRPVEDLQMLAQLLTGRRFLDAPNVVTLTAHESDQAWQTLRSRYPDAFEASAGQVQAWHRQKAEGLARVGRWRDALVHLDHALAAGPTRWALLVARGRVHREMGDWERAAADHEAALTMIPGELEAARDLGLAYLASGRRERFDEVRRRLDRPVEQDPEPRPRAVGCAHHGPGTDQGGRPPGPSPQVVRDRAGDGAERAERLSLHGGALLRAGRTERRRWSRWGRPWRRAVTTRRRLRSRGWRWPIGSSATRPRRPSGGHGPRRL